MKNKYLKEVVERLIAIEKSIVKLTDGLGSRDLDNPPAKWSLPIKRARANSKTRYRLLRSFSAEFPAGSDGGVSICARTEIEGMFASLKGDIREHRQSRIIEDILIALNFAALQYGTLQSIKIAAKQYEDDELQSLAEDGLNSSADSFAELRKYPPILFALELNPDLEDMYVGCLALGVEQAWAPPEED